MAELHTVCMRPGGMNRGGVRHVGHQVRKTEDFTPDQLREMLDEPDLALVFGGEKLTEKHVAAIEAAAKKAKG